MHPILSDRAAKGEPVSRLHPLGIRGCVQRSAERAAENEATFRAANEGLEEKAAELGFGEERTPYLCECEDERCTDVIRLTRAEYETVRANPKTFAMVPGHQEPDDAVLREEPGFTVIEKAGEEGELVAKRDPRM
jgi:hypothetical protein